MSGFLSFYPKYQSNRPIRTLLSLYHQNLGNIGRSIIFYLIKHSPEWLRPLIVANIIDIITQPEQHTLRELWFNGAILAISILQNVPTHYLHRRYMSLATRSMESRLRIALAQKLQQLSLSFYHRHSTGVLQSKLLQDVQAIEVLTTQIFQFLPSTLITIGIAVVVTAIKVPWFLLFFAATVPISAILIKLLRQPLKERNHSLRRHTESMSARLIEMIKLIPLTRAHGVETTEINKTESQLEKVRQAAIGLDSINAITNASSWVTLRLFSSICLVTSASLAFTGRMNVSVGDVVLLTGYFDSLTMGIVQIFNILPQLGKGFEAIGSIGEILESSELEQDRGLVSLDLVQGEFSFKKVSTIYPHAKTNAITDFTLEVEPGETIALVGHSGAGKSTLLNLIIGFMKPTSGEILLDGRDLTTIDKRTYRRFISVVSQETILFEGTVRENILYGNEDISKVELQQAIEDANAYEFICNLPQGLETIIGENGVKLSGGQRQRLAIARALIRNPRVLILDEATASLDTASESLIQSALERLMQQRTTFVAAHRFSTIRQADRIVVLEKGKIVEVGDYSSLLINGGVFAKLHSLQT